MQSKNSQCDLEAIAAQTQLYAKLKAQFEHNYNPMAVFCRLRELGFDQRDALEVAKYYELAFYEPVHNIVNYYERNRHA